MAYELINKVHTIVYDECYSLPIKDAQRIATKISKFSMQYFLMKICDGMLYDILEIRMVSEYLLVLQDWPFDDFENHVALIQKFNIVVDTDTKEEQEEKALLLRQKMRIVENLISIIKNMY